MTPLEELQAAHTRLSELVTGHNNGHAWMQLRDHAGIESACADGPHFIADVTEERTAELIVALHRTIDAQLVLIAEAMEDLAGIFIGDCSYPYQVLALARAINGEALPSEAMRQKEHSS